MRISKKYTPIIFGLVMGFLMTLVMSFAMVAINVGFAPNFFIIWLNSFITGFIVGTPVALLAGPIASKVVEWVTYETQEAPPQAETA